MLLSPTIASVNISRSPSPQLLDPSPPHSTADSNFSPSERAFSGSSDSGSTDSAFASSHRSPLVSDSHSPSRSPVREVSSETTFRDKLGWDPSLGLLYWWQVARVLYMSGSRSIDMADYESAFVQLAQAGTLLLVLLPSHPEFTMHLTASQQTTILKPGWAILNLLSKSARHLMHEHASASTTELWDIFIPFDSPVSHSRDLSPERHNASNDERDVETGTYASTCPLDLFDSISDGPCWVSLKELSPWTDWNWRITGRVVQKTDMIVSDNGNSFSFHITLEDDSGSIGGMAFNSAADKLFFFLEEGHVYDISKGTVQYADPQDQVTYKLVMDDFTEVEECPDEDGVHSKYARFVSGLRNPIPWPPLRRTHTTGVQYSADLTRAVFTDIRVDLFEVGHLQGESPETLARRIFYSAWHSISRSKPDISERGEEMLSTRGEVAKALVDLIQVALDSSSFSPNIHRKGWKTYNIVLRRYLIRLCRTSGNIPASLFIHGVDDVELQSLSHGGYSDVFRAKWQTQTVALKRLRIFTSSEEDDISVQAFYREAIVWRQLRHPNILPLLGIDTQTYQHSPCMVSPLCAKGDVVTAMRDLEPQVALGTVDTWLLQIAKGLEYLHDQELVHGDVRGGNILVDDDLRIQLADFGLSTVVGSTTLTLGPHPGGTVRWMAPELLKGDISRPNYVADVYSYGCTCIELYTRQRPFPQIALDAQVVFKVMYGARPTRPDESSWKTMTDELWKLVQSCWGDERPSMSDIVRQLSTIR